MIKMITNLVRKSQSAVVIENLLILQKNFGNFSGDAKRISVEIVEKTWDSRKDQLNGKRGNTPHKLSLAAISISDAIEGEESVNPFPYAYQLSLGTILQEVSENEHLYPFNGLDSKLLQSAAQTYQKYADRHAKSDLGREVKEMLDFSQTKSGG